jgi:hypothetical protein
MARLHAGFSPRWVILLLGALLVGCATPRVDWNARIGTYVYDQAVLDLGPPDKQAKLQDGTVVAEWLTRRGYYHSYNYAPFAYGYYPWWSGAYYPSYIDSYSPDYYLRLIFSPEGKLSAWKNFYK